MENLPPAGHCAKYFPYIPLPNKIGKPLRDVLLLVSFCGWEAKARTAKVTCEDHTAPIRRFPMHYLLPIQTSLEVFLEVGMDLEDIGTPIYPDHAIANKGVQSVAVIALGKWHQNSGFVDVLLGSTISVLGVSCSQRAETLSVYLA